LGAVGGTQDRLFRTYENDPGSLSNLYAVVSIFATTCGEAVTCTEEAPMLTVLHAISLGIASVLARAASLLSRVQQTVAQARADRARIEAELFHGRYHLSSKNDDDLPLVR
jgi:hypothetical protein